MLPETVSSKLRPHQARPAEHLLQVLRRFGSGVDLSDTGTGKTYVACAIAKVLNTGTLVVGPKISKSAWIRAAEHFDDSISFSNYELLRTGNTNFGKWDSHKPSTSYFKCVCCQCRVDPARPEPCFAHSRGIHCIETKREPPRYGNFKFHPGVRFLVLDEGHRCNGLASLNAGIAIAAKRQRIPTLCLSATPASSPLNLRALGFLLDLHNDRTDKLNPGPLPTVSVPAFSRWLRSFGYRQDPRFHGWHWFASESEQSRVMSLLRAAIIPERGVRIRTFDIPGFPAVDTQAELYTLDDPEEIDGCYGVMKEALDRLHISTLSDKNPEHPLTKILRARQKIELLKVPVMAELAEDYRAKGFSVVWFVNYRATIDELFKRFPEAGIIDGQTGDRDKIIDRFQKNISRELICNSEAGGISMSVQDLNGGFPRIGLVSPGFSATTFRQVLGRLPRDGGKSTAYYRVILAAGTVETKVKRALDAKLNNLSALTDVDFLP